MILEELGDHDVSACHEIDQRRGDMPRLMLVVPAQDVRGFEQRDDRDGAQRSRLDDDRGRPGARRVTGSTSI